MEDIQYVKNRVSYIINEYGPGNSLFNTKDINRLLDQIGIEEQQNEMLIKECEDLKSRVVVDEHELERCEVLLSESLEAMKWMFKNMQVVDSNLQSDAFNIPANAIDQLEKHLEIFNRL